MMKAKKQAIVKKAFRVKAPVMLTAAKTVCENFEANRAAFAGDNPHMTQEWLGELRSDIERMDRKVGVKANEQQRKATQQVLDILGKAGEGLLVVKMQMESGYRGEKARLGELSGLLGFRKHWKQAGNGNQNAMLELLFTFDNHTGAGICAELESRKVSAERIASVKGYAQKLDAANVAQETLKGEAPAITAATMKGLNSIYYRIIDICRMGRIIFRGDQAKQALFNFSKLSAQQVSARKAKGTGEG